jgi:hypothetical protein
VRAIRILRLNTFALYDIRHRPDKLTIADEMLDQFGVIHSAVIQIFCRVIQILDIDKNADALMLVGLRMSCTAFHKFEIRRANSKVKVKIQKRRGAGCGAGRMSVRAFEFQFYFWLTLQI